MHPPHFSTSPTVRRHSSSLHRREVLSLRPLHRSRQGGFTLIELIIALGVMLTAFMIFSSTVAGVTEQRVVNWENGIAANAAQTAIERMHNEDFHEVFALFNDDPSDDPGGPGTAPGHRFAVDELPALDTAADGLVGEIYFPAAWIGPDKGEVQVPLPIDAPDPAPLSGRGAAAGNDKEALNGDGGAPESGAPPTLQLREDLTNELLGTPRDLNGDSIIDDQNHGGDYVILPVRVELRWASRLGDRKYAVQTILCTYRRD